MSFQPFLGFGGRNLVVSGTTYATWSTSDKTANTTLSNGNLTITGNSNNARGRADKSFAAGKWYWETLITTAGVASMGIANSSWNVALTQYMGNDANAAAVYFPDGTVYFNAGGSAFGAISNGDRLMHAFDTASLKYWVGKNGTWFNSGDPAAGTGQCATVGSGTWYPGYDSRGTTATANFGASAFSYSVPSGFNSGVY